MSEPAWQTGTQVGPIRALCAADLTGKEGCGCKFNSSRKMALTSATDDDIPFICLEGAAADEYGTFAPFTKDRNHRVKLGGTVAVGAKLEPAANGLFVTIDTGTPVATFEGSGAANATAGASGDLGLARPL